MNPVAEDILMHYGMPRRSGRYPWGSGDNPYQHEDDFLTPRSSSRGPSQAKINMMKSMKAAGYTLQEIADRTGFSASTVAKNL